MHSLGLVYRFKLKPLSPWGSSLDSDFLSGLLCLTAARTRGPEFLVGEILEPALAGKPRFALSSACPNDLLPAPRWLELHDRRFAGVEYLPRQTFTAALRGEAPAFDPSWTDSGIAAAPAVRVQVSRGDARSWHHQSIVRTFSPSLERERRFLSLYVAIDPLFFDTFRGLLAELCETGIGRGAGTGHGWFSAEGLPERIDWLLRAAQGAPSSLSLSHFQPGPDETARGAWRATVKQGHFAQELAASDEPLTKKRFALFEPGSLVGVKSQRGYVGRAIPASELLTETAAASLRERGLRPIHYAYGLAVPAHESRSA